MKTAKKTAKQKKTQQILIGAFIIVILIALYFKFRKPKEEPGTSTAVSSSSGSATASGSGGLKRVGNDTILKSGTKAEEVKWVQSLYNSNYAVPLGKTKLSVDGIFGPKTSTAVKFVMGKTSTSWTEFKRFVDNTASPTSVQPAQNIFINPIPSENIWPWM